MTQHLLFCTAEEAKAFVPQVLASEEGQGIYPWALVESRQGLRSGQPFRDRQRGDETFETDFIGASVADCGAWTLERIDNNCLFTDSMIILDARSAKDQTVTLCIYPLPGDAAYLRRDQEPETWYPFRVHYLKIWNLSVEFSDTGDPHDTYGALFRRSEEFTDSNGLFDYDGALEVILAGEGGVNLKDRLWDRVEGAEDMVQ
ncbi:hypothetical protein F5Y03DRAFT_402951 [Xylaria venustula]|nr:hypothetical protein F5Y03DRAFT_402951 [Xylaria venustula]